MKIPPFGSLVWGSLRLTPMNGVYYTPVGRPVYEQQSHGRTKMECKLITSTYYIHHKHGCLSGFQLVLLHELWLLVASFPNMETSWQCYVAIYLHLATY